MRARRSVASEVPGTPLLPTSEFRSRHAATRGASGSGFPGTVRFRNEPSAIRQRVAAPETVLPQLVVDASRGDAEDARRLRLIAVRQPERALQQHALAVRDGLRQVA